MFAKEVVQVPLKYKLLRGAIILMVVTLVEAFLEGALDKKFLK